jgi:deoxyribodipyrimidine photo-lyase
MLLLEITHVNAAKDTGVGRWVQELAWRDFYTCILASFPRVSMGRPFLERFAAVKWESPEDDNNEGALRKWEEGKTGVPIVDAAMRCISQTGWMHNRMRMISAMYLTKDLMLDWVGFILFVPAYSSYLR